MPVMEPGHKIQHVEMPSSLGYADILMQSGRQFIGALKECRDCGLASSWDILQAHANFTWMELLCVIVCALAWTGLRMATTTWIFQPFIKWCHLQPKEAEKVPESAWKLLFYSCSWSYCFYLLFFTEHNFFHDPPSTFHGWKSRVTVPKEIALVYLIQGSFYAHSTYATLYMDAWRKDSIVMIVHHVVTFTLISFSYAFRASFSSSSVGDCTSLCSPNPGLRTPLKTPSTPLPPGAGSPMPAERHQIHHVLTALAPPFELSTLQPGSHQTDKYHNIGILVLFLHDFNDILLEFTKLNIYFKTRGGKYHKINAFITDIGSVLFSVSWFWFRLYWFPMKVLYVTCCSSLESNPNIPFYFFFNILLFLLTLMNIYWFLYIVMFVVKVITGQVKEVNDVREYDISEDQKMMMQDHSKTFTRHKDTMNNKQYMSNGYVKKKRV
ncbi:ceramide synthase 1 isoform X2 [Ranitomeya imitator]|uniref:ceramide synthase 1 isoform X2 n=1 Tax=Ranitomeya imitator TaxID=111125 RepID=UPI0037E81A08